MKKTGWDETERRVFAALWRGLFLLAVGAALLCLGHVLNPPNLLCRPLDGPTSTARAVLANLHRAQLQLREAGAIDRDADGHGEFGSWHDLLQQHLFAFATDPTDCASRAGYRFQIWLPTRHGWIGHGVPPDADAAEHGYCAYAWPEDDHAPRPALFVDERGDVYQTRGVASYRGLELAVPVDAALPSSDADCERGDWGHVGRDGNTWVIVQ